MGRRLPSLKGEGSTRRSKAVRGSSGSLVSFVRGSASLRAYVDKSSSPNAIFNPALTPGRWNKEKKNKRKSNKQQTQQNNQRIFLEGVHSFVYIAELCMGDPWSIQLTGVNQAHINLARIDIWASSVFNASSRVGACQAVAKSLRRVVQSLTHSVSVTQPHPFWEGTLPRQVGMCGYRRDYHRISRYLLVQIAVPVLAGVLVILVLPHAEALVKPGERTPLSWSRAASKLCATHRPWLA
jgi:hypothetical protein